MGYQGFAEQVLDGNVSDLAIVIVADEIFTHQRAKKGILAHHHYGTTEESRVLYYRLAALARNVQRIAHSWSGRVVAAAAALGPRPCSRAAGFCFGSLQHAVPARLGC